MVILKREEKERIRKKIKGSILIRRAGNLERAGLRKRIRVDIVLISMRNINKPILF